MSEPEASPEQQAAVRRLLAGARHDEPTPPEVVARLDSVLAGLRSEVGAEQRPVGQPTATVHDLATRRRRRVTRLLGAAAAVVVLGVGVGTLSDRTLDGRQGDDSGAESATSAEDRDTAGAGSESGPAPQAAAPLAEVPTVTSADLRASVLRLRDVAPVQQFGDVPLKGESLTTDALFVCGTAAYGPGRLLPVLYDDTPAVLAYRPVTGDVQPVELLQCGTATVLRSVVVPRALSGAGPRNAARLPSVVAIGRPGDRSSTPRNPEETRPA